jgi:hypothetical protein
MSMRRSSGGRSSSRSAEADLWAAEREFSSVRRAFRDACHNGDSGITVNASRPSTAGAAASWKIHRHDSGVMCQVRAICESMRIPPLRAAPISPAMMGRDLSGQHSAASATAFGHTPPTPRPTMKRSTSICSCVCTNAPSPANTE